LNLCDTGVEIITNQKQRATKQRSPTKDNNSGSTKNKKKSKSVRNQLTQYSESEESEEDSDDDGTNVKKRRSPRLKRKKSRLAIASKQYSDSDSNSNEESDDSYYKKKDTSYRQLVYESGKHNNISKKTYPKHSPKLGNSTGNTEITKNNHNVIVDITSDDHMASDETDASKKKKASNVVTEKTDTKKSGKRKKDESIEKKGKTNKNNTKKLKIIESNGWCTQTLTQIFTPDGRRKKGQRKTKPVETDVITEEITEVVPLEESEKAVVNVSEDVTLTRKEKHKGKKVTVKESVKADKNATEEECEYDIPAFKGVLHENRMTPTHIVEVVKPIGILNVRKGKGWLAEVLLNYNNGINEWWFVHGAWGLMEDETEAFLAHYNLDFEICGYKKDPRENRRYQYLRKFADEFTEEEIAKDDDKDYDALTYNIHSKLADNVLEHYFVEEEPSDDDVEEEEEEEGGFNPSNDYACNDNASIASSIATEIVNGNNNKEIIETNKENHEARSNDDNDAVTEITP
jgi:hypothetical protein